MALLVLAWAAAGSRVAAADEPRQGQPIVLPPFLVEDQPVRSLVNRTDWLYFQGGGWEVLSACPEDETEQFIRELREQREALSQFIPDGLLLRTTLPTTLILFPRSQKNELDAQMVREVERVPGASTSGHFTPMNDLRLSDPDSSYIFIILDDWQWGWDIRHGFPRGQGTALFYSPPFLRFLIASRTPALPDWFVVGMTRLYESLAVNNGRTGAIASVWTLPAVVPENALQDGEFQADTWISEGAAASLRGHAEAPRPLLPMRELLVPVVPPGKSELYRRVWESQAELFVRWTYSGRVKDGKARLRRFAEAAAAQPVTEELFQSCFGMGYADARDALSDFLPAAVAKGQPFAFGEARVDPAPAGIRAAGPAEIHRIKGEWARRTLRVVRANFPDALALYAAKARAVLQGPYDHGERDPLLVASLALLRFETGDAGDGRRLLEEQPAAAAVRPWAGLELASLRVNDALGSPAGARGELSEEQAAAVLQEASGADGKLPPIETAYLLAARVSMHLGRDPTDGERARLNAGARLFPRDSQMVAQCASWDIRAHDLASARSLVELGEYEAPDAPARDAFRRLGRLILSASADGN